jgi:protein-tyrosine-phosphatase/predicted ATP-grasp superfamily ATP-dependent carboligase
MKRKILLLGLTNKSGLAVARNLCKFGCEVDAILMNDVAAKYSKYINSYYYLSEPERDVDLFISKLLEHLSLHKYDGLIPIHDGALEICRFKIHQISTLVKVAGLNPDNVYKYSIDKSEFLKIGKQNGLPVPKGALVKSLDNFSNLDLSKLNFPIVAKPVSSTRIQKNKLVWYSVKICYSQYELIDFVRENVNCTPILIQEFIKGYGIGYNIIAKDGVIQYEYIHRRINENKGVSSLRESLSTDNFGLKVNVTKMIKYMAWNGVGMVEFMIKTDGSPVLMEFNGRFFGSTELSVKSGINLPVLFFKQFILNENNQKNIIFKKATVRFLHDEILLYTQLLFQKRIKTFAKWFSELSLSLFKKRHYIEDSFFSDPKFFFALYLYDIKRWREKWKLKRVKRNVNITPVKTEDLVYVKNIAFVCYGNICRSPFAKLVAQKISKNYNFDSFGFINKENRLSPINAINAAENFNIDLNKHSSKSILSIDIKKVDLYIVMDKLNYISLRNERIPESKIRFLSNEEIEDPYGKTKLGFQLIYENIASKITNIFKND